MTTLVLPYPTLAKGRFGVIEAYSDDALYDACGVRVAFTTRVGGVSQGPYESLNLGLHVNDDTSAVHTNRMRMLEAFTTSSTPLLVPNQVHGDTIVSIADVDEIPEVQQRIDQGCDGLIVGAKQVGTLLCFADCVPVIVVSPTGRFAVVHAGWRGVINTIASKSVTQMAHQEAAVLGTDASRSYNVYIGPHIRGECFETSEEIYKRFISRFGSSCDVGYRHISLSDALRTQLEEVGIDSKRIIDSEVCTVCSRDEFFSFRAQQGVAGRHGAFAVAT